MKAVKRSVNKHLCRIAQQSALPKIPRVFAGSTAEEMAPIFPANMPVFKFQVIREFVFRPLASGRLLAVPVFYKGGRRHASL